MNKIFNIECDLSKSHGSYVYDNLSRKFFFDAFMMYSALPLGYNHEIFGESFRGLVKSICPQKVSNSVFSYTELNAFLRAIGETSELRNVHLCSTGALAVESAIKAALHKHGGKRTQVLSLTNGFHGVNSWGFLTDRNAFFAKKRLEFFPDIPWPKISIDGLLKYLTDPKNQSSLAAFIFEPIQCTAGDIYLPVEILSEARDICHKNDICFIADEIQTGMGTTGSFWKSISDGLDPDILIFGKKSQVSGIMTNEKYNEVMKNSNQILSVTFDGDLMDVVRGWYVLKAISQYSLLKNISDKSMKLRGLICKSLKNYRSMGGLVAFDFNSSEERDNFSKVAFNNFLLVNSTGENSIRIRLNLSINDSEIDDLSSRIHKTLRDIR